MVTSKRCERETATKRSSLPQWIATMQDVNNVDQTENPTGTIGMRLPSLHRRTGSGAKPSMVKHPFSNSACRRATESRLAVPRVHGHPSATGQRQGCKDHRLSQHLLHGIG